MEFSLLNDEPVAGPEDDLLGTGRAARELARLLHDSRGATPFTLAVDAGWGMGKSSLMRLVDAELQAKEGVRTFWYNAWTSTGADALEGLIKSVLEKFDKRLLRRAAHRVSEQRAVIGVVRTALTLLAGPLGAAGLVDQLWRELSVDAKSRNAMRDELRNLATQWAESTPYATRQMLVVFIDDLDRCSEETVLAVCEAVKVYLDVPGLAFVIGCDRSALGPSGLLRDLSPAGSAFMEKIFQTSYRVPVADGRGVEAYVRDCAKRSGVQELLADDSLVQLIADRSARNPRRIKRLINGFGLECALNPVWERFSSEAVIRTLLLQYLYADFYRSLLASDRSHGNAAWEFLDYRVARRVLSQPFVQPDQEAWLTTANCVTEHGLNVPSRENPEDWGSVLARLEEYLPTGFPQLERDRNFVVLIEELMGMDEASELVEQLRSGAAPVTVVQSDEERESEEGRRRYAGAQVLWVDDHPGNNTRFVLELESLGARVLMAPDRARAEQVLRVSRIDLLISDVARGSDGDAGFTELQSWRDRGLYEGPVVFFAGRITPNRLARCRELDAQITMSGAELLEFVDAALAARRETPPPA
ncbi:P-loop NTPase fold protein [Streptomyces sp. NPDC001530]|uniref:P-loop NTPase fold protein n=1 Tax=Streptomyces sp. NPDC001530 TaxID=3364582 RepID=UPI0036C34A7B